jgi:DHA1 family bicyclomycin/chloramphenicol resistance-like MFS transporter
VQQTHQTSASSDTTRLPASSDGGPPSGRFSVVMPNGTALALEAHAGRAGTAAALLGAFQSMIGALAAPLVGLDGSGSALPMAVVVCGCATLSLLGAITLTRRRIAT